MKIFYKFTGKYLVENRTRTIVTLIGIILSMSLFTAVIEGAYSGIRFLQNCEIETEGAWHGYYSDLTKEAAEELMAKSEIDQAAEVSQVGWAQIDSENQYKPYLLVKSVSEGIEDLLSIRMISGRMPENSSEILLPEHLASNGNVIYEIGDTVTLRIGKRVSGTDVLEESTPFLDGIPETISDVQEKNYTVTGIYERFSYTIESYSCPGYTAFTVDTPGGSEDSSSVFFTLKNPKNYEDFVSTSNVMGKEVAHSELLELYGVVRNTNLNTMIYGFAAVLCFLIAFGSISLIYNSFSISVSERTKQFGILKSVGATKAQIRATVLYEALFLDVAAIPIGLVTGCVGIGITLYGLQDAFSSLAPKGISTRMQFIAAPKALLTAAVICIVTTLISALIPARRAMRIPAIDAIRQTTDVKMERRQVRTSWLTEKLFGFEGMMAAKNFKRNKKRYRATIISLFLSITLFISASSFCVYLKDSVGGITSEGAVPDISYYMYAPDSKLSFAEIHALLLSAEDVTEGVYANETSDSFYIDPGLVDASFFRDYLDKAEMETHPIDEHCRIYFINDAYFNAICEANGIDPEGYFDEKNPKALFYNHKVVAHAAEGEARKWYSYSFIDQSKLPCTLYSEGIKEIDGYVEYGFWEEEGRRDYIYYPTDYLEKYWASHEDDSELDRAKVRILSEEDAVVKYYYTVNGIVEKIPFAIAADEFALIYPLCAQQSVVDDNRPLTTSFSYRSANHKQTFTEMKKLLNDNHLDTSMLEDIAEMKESSRMLITVINIFSYGFIILISLIAIANVFNTISTNISLRRREFAMLKSIGMGEKSFRKMMNYECMIYGLKSLLWGLPASFAVTYLIYTITQSAYNTAFYVPWTSVVIAVGSVFLVVFATMLYSMSKIRKDNPIDALKNENI